MPTERDIGSDLPRNKVFTPPYFKAEAVREVFKSSRQLQVLLGKNHLLFVVNTAWDSEIESLTSLNPGLIKLDRRKTRRRHRVTAALAPRKSCFLPCNANLHASSASLKHGLTTAFFFRMIQLSSSSARRDHSCDR